MKDLSSGGNFNLGWGYLNEKKSYGNILCAKLIEVHMNEIL